MGFFISIHAPAGGATGEWWEKHSKNIKFQFTPLREGRLIPVWGVRFDAQFQFTPLREGRRGGHWLD